MMYVIFRITLEEMKPLRLETTLIEDSVREKWGGMGLQGPVMYRNVR